jgi:hypothetical protein
MTQLILTGTGGTGISSFTGSPALNLESSLAIYDGPFYNGQMSFGPYTSTSNCTPSSSEYCGFVNMGLGIPGFRRVGVIQGKKLIYRLSVPYRAINQAEATPLAVCGASSVGVAD